MYMMSEYHLDGGLRISHITTTSKSSCIIKTLLIKKVRSPSLQFSIHRFKIKLIYLQIESINN